MHLAPHQANPTNHGLVEMTLLVVWSQSCTWPLCGARPQHIIGRLREDARALEYGSESCRSDREIVMLAVKKKAHDM
eukprot:5958416-Amphidinium_carterae.1